MKKVVILILVVFLQIGYSQNDEAIVFPVYFEPTNNVNLVSNPYPSAINLDRFFELNAGVIDPVAYIWGRTLQNPDDTPNGSNGGPYVLSYSPDSYIIYNPTMMVVPTQNTLFNSAGTLASCQSFFIQTVSNNPDFDYSSSVTFNNSLRTKVENNTFARQASTSNDDKLWINILNEKAEKISQSGFAFIMNASDEYNTKEDVKTFRNNKTTFYSIIDDLDLIINIQSSFLSSKVIPLGITTSNEIGSQLTISIDKKQGVFNNNEIYIYDKLNNTYNEISNSNYVFAVSITIMDDRFILCFEKSKIENLISRYDQVSIINDNHSVTVKSENKTKIKSIEVFDIYNFSINGQQLLTLKEINSDKENFVINEKHKLLLIITTLENGTVIHKKITN